VKLGHGDREQFLRLSQDKDILGLHESKVGPEDQHFTISEQNMKEIQVNNNNQKMVLSQNGNPGNQSKKSL